MLLPIIVPVIFWAIYHYHKDRHLPEPPGNLLLCFGLGVLASFLAGWSYELLGWIGLRMDAVGLAISDPAALFAYTMLVIGPVPPDHEAVVDVGDHRVLAVPGALRSKLEQGGVVVFASAAALTLGVATVPVYEIYKCGHEPFWADGLDLLAGIGIEAAVIPHYDNAEGGHHDTRFCYLGERRLTHMETMLPEDTWVLGIDEHTGLVIDLDAGQAEVTGNGGVTLRVDGESLHHPTGSILDLAILTDRAAVSRTIRGDASTVRATEIADDHASDLATIPASAEQTVESSLADTADRADREFSAAISAGDAATATGVMLELETAIWAWSADTLQSDETDRARQVLRSMVTRLGEAAVAGLADPRAVVAPLVDLLLQLRSDARAEKRFEVSDLIRDRLDETGVEVRDTADGAEWDLRA